jgi:excisionase family DNA binding protein
MADVKDRDAGVSDQSLSRLRDTELLTVEEVAAILKLTKKGIYSLVEARRIPFVKVSNRLRFFYGDVVAWLLGNRVPSEN